MGRIPGSCQLAAPPGEAIHVSQIVNSDKLIVADLVNESQSDHRFRSQDRFSFLVKDEYNIISEIEGHM